MATEIEALTQQGRPDQPTARARDGHQVATTVFTQAARIHISHFNDLTSGEPLQANPAASLLDALSGHNPTRHGKHMAPSTAIEAGTLTRQHVATTGGAGEARTSPIMVAASSTDCWHTWPDELLPDSHCTACGLEYLDWSA